MSVNVRIKSFIRRSKVIILTLVSLKAFTFTWMTTKGSTRFNAVADNYCGDGQRRETPNHPTKPGNPHVKINDYLNHPLSEYLSNGLSDLIMERFSRAFPLIF